MTELATINDEKEIAAILEQLQPLQEHISNPDFLRSLIGQLKQAGFNTSNIMKAIEHLSPNVFEKTTEKRATRKEITNTKRSQEIEMKEDDSHTSTRETEESLPETQPRQIPETLPQTTNKEMHIPTSMPVHLQVLCKAVFQHQSFDDFLKKINTPNRCDILEIGGLYFEVVRSRTGQWKYIELKRISPSSTSAGYYVTKEESDPIFESKNEAFAAILHSYFFINDCKRFFEIVKSLELPHTSDFAVLWKGIGDLFLHMEEKTSVNKSHENTTLESIIKPFFKNNDYESHYRIGDRVFRVVQDLSTNRWYPYELSPIQKSSIYQNQKPICGPERNFASDVDAIIFILRNEFNIHTSEEYLSFLDLHPQDPKIQEISRETESEVESETDVPEPPMTVTDIKLPDTMPSHVKIFIMELLEFDNFGQVKKFLDKNPLTIGNQEYLRQLDPNSFGWRLYLCTDENKTMVFDEIFAFDDTIDALLLRKFFVRDLSQFFDLIVSETEKELIPHWQDIWKKIIRLYKTSNTEVLSVE